MTTFLKRSYGTRVSVQVRTNVFSLAEPFILSKVLTLVMMTGQPSQLVMSLSSSEFMALLFTSVTLTTVTVIKYM